MGKIYCYCGNFLPPLSEAKPGERTCETCRPQPHRVLMDFQQHNVWDLSFLAIDVPSIASSSSLRSEAEPISTSCDGASRDAGDLILRDCGDG